MLRWPAEIKALQQHTISPSTASLPVAGCPASPNGLEQRNNTLALGQGAGPLPLAPVMGSGERTRLGKRECRSLLAGQGVASCASASVEDRIRSPFFSTSWPPCLGGESVGSAHYRGVAWSLFLLIAPPRSRRGPSCHRADLFENYFARSSSRSGLKCHGDFNQRGAELNLAVPTAYRRRQRARPSWPASRRKVSWCVRSSTRTNRACHQAGN